MQIGDLVSFQKRPWQIESQRDENFVLRAWEGDTAEVHPKDRDLRKVAQPNEWPFLTAPVRNADGRLVKVTMTREGKVWMLEPLIDWVPADRIRPGGPIFISPKLKLKIGEILIVHYHSKRLARLTVTASFGSISQRHARAQKAAEPQTTAHDLIASGDLFDET